MVSLLLSQKDTPIGPDLPSHPCRLVTLLGPGGAGKTRLAAVFARMASEQHGLFCVFALLADLSDPAQIPAQIAQALRLPSNPARSPLDQVVDFLCSRDRPGMPPALLVLDNMEHLLEVAGEPTVAGFVQILLRDAPGLTVLTTSRRRLGLQGERLLPVSPLPTPDAPDDAQGPDGLADLLNVPSVRLYLDRAQAVRPDFDLTAVNAPAVAALCRTLEGSPLALELAASWVRLLPPRKMWERLAQGMEMPAGRDADLPERHKSLTAALDWSWRLLTERQRRLLSCLSVFRGGWTAEAAEVVCDEPNALSLLADLQEASLVTVAEGNDGEARYGFLETVRQDTLRRLRAGSQEADVRGRHLAWHLALAEAAERGLTGPGQGAWLARLETEHDNLRAALDWSASVPEEAERGLRLSIALSRFWTVRGHMTEGRRRLEAALTDAAAAPTGMRADALHALGALAHAQGDNAAAERHLADCLIIRREDGEEAACADPLRLLAMVARQRGDYATAQTLLTESLALARAAGNETDAIGATVGLGHIAMLSGNLGDAREFYAQSLPFYRAVGDRRGCAGALGNLGNVASAQGDYVGAQGLLAECLALYREIGDRRGCAITRHSQSTNAFKLGDLEAAITLIRECITLYRDLGDQWNPIDPLESLAVYLTQKGRWERATSLRSAAETMRQKRGIRRTPLGEENFTEEICTVRQTLGEAAFQTAWTAGQTMSWEQAIEYALDPREQP